MAADGAANPLTFPSKPTHECTPVHGFDSQFFILHSKFFIPQFRGTAGSRSPPASAANF